MRSQCQSVICDEPDLDLGPPIHNNTSFNYIIDPSTAHRKLERFIIDIISLVP